MNIYILTHDKSLAELISAELRAEGQASCSFGNATASVPADCCLLLVDLDTVDRYSIPLYIRNTVAITRREGALTEAERAGFSAVLHRPFPLPLLHEAVRRLLTEETAEPSVKQKRHRVTARRNGKASSPLRFDSETGAILIEGDKVALTKGEETVFCALLDAAGEAVSRDTLRLLLSGERESNLPDVHVCAIRKKLAPFGREYLIRTVRGVGYCISG